MCTEGGLSKTEQTQLEKARFLRTEQKPPLTPHFLDRERVLGRLNHDNFKETLGTLYRARIGVATRPSRRSRNGDKGSVAVWNHPENSRFRSRQRAQICECALFSACVSVRCIFLCE